MGRYGKGFLIPLTRRVLLLAEELLTLEGRATEDLPATSERSLRVCERLRVPLALLVGRTGYETLLSRALMLTQAEFPRLDAVTVKPGDCLEGFGDINPRLSEPEAREGEILVVGYLLELLRTFLGETLMLRLIRDVWPTASFADTRPEQEIP